MSSINIIYLILLFNFQNVGIIPDYSKFLVNAKTSSPTAGLNKQIIFSNTISKNCFYWHQKHNFIFTIQTSKLEIYFIIINHFNNHTMASQLINIKWVILSCFVKSQIELISCNIFYHSLLGSSEVYEIVGKLVKIVYLNQNRLQRQGNISIFPFSFVYVCRRSKFNFLLEEIQNTFRWTPVDNETPEN